MIINITYEGEPVTITTDTDDPDELTSYVLNNGASVTAQQGIAMIAMRGLGAFGHVMNGKINNRDFIAALDYNLMSNTEVLNVTPPLKPYSFPPRTVS